MLHLNSLVGELLGAELSHAISGLAITFLEYDQATWGYALFDCGNVIDRFWSIPECVEVPPDEYMGNAEIISRVFNVAGNQIAPYLRHITDSAAKAFSDDEFTLGDHWVRVDFMRRLGLSYPNPGEVAGGRYVEIGEPKG